MPNWSEWQIQFRTKKNKKIEDIRKGFVVIAKHAKADIVPVSVVGFDGYAKRLFENCKDFISVYEDAMYNEEEDDDE